MARRSEAQIYGRFCLGTPLSRAVSKKAHAHSKRRMEPAAAPWIEEAPPNVGATCLIERFRKTRVGIPSRMHRRCTAPISARTPVTLQPAKPETPQGTGGASTCLLLHPVFAAGAWPQRGRAGDRPAHLRSLGFAIVPATCALSRPQPIHGPRGGLLCKGRSTPEGHDGTALWVGASRVRQRQPVGARCAMHHPMPRCGPRRRDPASVARLRSGFGNQISLVRSKGTRRRPERASGTARGDHRGRRSGVATVGGRAVAFGRGAAC